MCDHTKTAIEVIQAQPRKTLSKEETLMLFKKVIEDNEKLGGRMTNMEKRLEALETKMEAGFKDIKELLEKRPLTVFEKIVALKDHRMFWITIIVTLLIISALMGVPMTGFNGILNVGG